MVLKYRPTYRKVSSECFHKFHMTTSLRMPKFGIKMYKLIGSPPFTCNNQQASELYHQLGVDFEQLEQQSR